MLILAAPAFALEPVEEAVGVHVSASGLDRLGGAIAGVMPTGFPVGALSGELACDDADPTQTLVWALDPLTVNLDIQDVALVPTDGALDLTLYGALSSSASTLTATGDCAPLADLAETCSVELPTVAIEAHVPITLAFTNGAFDATVGEVTLVLPPINNPLDGCVLSDAIGTLLGTNPSAISDLLQGAIAPSLEDLGPTVESALEDGLGALVIDTSLAVGDGEIELALAPTTFTVDEGGIFIGLGATVTPSVVSDCVPAGTPPAVDGAWPPLTGTAPDGALTYDAAAVVGGPFVDELLYGVWQSGALCLSLSDLGGAPLDTSLFAPILGDSWASLFPEAVPMTLEVRPERAPTASFAEDGAPLRIGLDGLGLAAYAPLDGREARIFSVDLTGTIGLDLPLADGTLTPTIVVDDGLEFVEPDHELLQAGYSDGLADFVPTILGSLLPALPSITIPSWRGIGLDWIWWMPSDDWLGGYAVLDVDHPEPLELSGCSGGNVGCDGDGLSTGDLDLSSQLGCSDAGGCGADSGCSSGGGTCSTSPLGVRGLPFFIALIVPFWRRRS